MQRLHYRAFGCMSTVVNRRRELRKEIVNMKNLGAELPNALCNSIPHRRGVGGEGGRLNLVERTFNVVVEYLHDIDSVSSITQHTRLLLDDNIFASVQLIAIVKYQYPHLD
jgi:hypothetical protein